MSEPRLISPLLDSFTIGPEISSHDGVSCYPAMRDGSDEKYIVKLIRLPATHTQLEALLLSGAYPTSQAASSYFRDQADMLCEESRLLNDLAAHPGFSPYIGQQAVPGLDGISYEVYLISPYRLSLEKFLRRNPLTHLQAVNMGIDLCDALSTCRDKGLLYVDLKPGNIFLTPNGEFTLGDLGFLSTDSLKYASLPDRYRSPWTAPEAADAFAPISTTMDIYALGLILYQVYNNGKLPSPEELKSGEALPSPEYADYEMAEIILKACAANPDDRWLDPREMGHALVSYMQRNGVNDVPIAPPVIPDPLPVETPAEEAADEPASGEEPETPTPDSAVEEGTPAEEAPADSPDDEWIDRLDQIVSEESAGDQDAAESYRTLTSDETAPTEEDAEDLSDTAVTEETDAMLTQAEELLAHQVPAPAVAPEPAPVLPEQDGDSEEESEEAADGEAAAEEASEEKETGEPGEEASTPEAEEPPAEVPEAPKKPKKPKKEKPVLTPRELRRRKRRIKRLIVTFVILILLGGLAFGGYKFYQDYYLQKVTALNITGTDDSMTVLIQSTADDADLLIRCSDTHGNSTTAPVVNGIAKFDNLVPDTQYTVSVEILGLHQLSGVTSDSYTTPAQTKILNFMAVSGPEDGSVILNFTVDGPETGDWIVSYEAEGEAEQSLSFSQHTVTVNNLVVGKDYTFTLHSATELYLTGELSLNFTAAKVILAENLEITGVSDGILSVEWTCPEDAEVSTWIVRCYNDAGYDESVEVEYCKASFSGISESSGYTVEVSAQGMTKSSRTYISANAVTIQSVSAEASTQCLIRVSWEYSGNVPEEGWLLLYSYDGGETQEVLRLDAPEVEITPAIPGRQYDFTIQLPTGATVFNPNFSVNTPEAPKFADYDVTADNISIKTLLTPEDENWRASKVTDSDYVTVFSPGDNASMLLRLNKVYNYDSKPILSTIIIWDSAGNAVRLSNESRPWKDMWNGGYCKIDIPSLPTTSGDYTIVLYFNGAYAGTAEFSIE